MDLKYQLSIQSMVSPWQFSAYNVYAYTISCVHSIIIMLRDAYYSNTHINFCDSF